LTERVEACIAPQNIYEFYSVVTNPKRVQPAITCEKAAEICRSMHESPELVKIHPSVNTPIIALSLAEEHGISGSEIFDCVLAAIMKENSVDIIYTQNVRDFKKYEFMRVEDPLTANATENSKS